MELRELLYAIEGEIEDAPFDSDLAVVIVTKDGRRYEPEAVASDGELLIVNAREYDDE